MRFFLSLLLILPSLALGSAARILSADTVLTAAGSPAFSVPLSSSDLPMFTQSGTGAVARTILSKLADPLSVKDFGALGDNSHDDTANIQAAINASSAAGGGTVFLPHGIYKATADINMAANVTLKGVGRTSSVISFNHTGNGLVMSSTINSSTAVNTTVRELGISNSNGSNTGGGYVDVAGSFVLLDSVSITGFKYGIIFDQTEVAHVTDAKITGQLLSGIWLVNCADHTVGASCDFTNVISIEKSQISESATAYGIIDDGGVSHTFKDNNYNGCLNHIWSSGADAQIISGGDFESSAGANIVLTSNTFHGAVEGSGISTTITGASFSQTSTNHAIDALSQGKLVVIGSNFFGSGTSVNFTSCFNFFGAGNHGFSRTGAATVMFENDTVAAFINGTVTLNSLSASQIVATDSSKNLVSIAYASAATASTLMSRDANSNVSVNSVTEAYASVATAGGTTTLDVTSAATTEFTGSSNQTVVLPNATTLVVGKKYKIINSSTGTLTVQANGGSGLSSMAAGAAPTEFFVTNIGTSAGTWTTASGGGTLTLPTYQQFTAPANAVSAGMTFTPSTNVTQVAYYRREGAYMVVDGQLTWTGIGAAGSVTISISGMAGSPVIDTGLLPGGTSTSNAGESMLGYAHVWSQGGSTWTAYFPVYASTTTFQFVSGGTRLGGTTYASGSVLNYTVRLPIVGWH